jgi:hypothetical protein
MGKTVRAACLFVPMLFIGASLLCLVSVVVGQLSRDNRAPFTSLGRDLYFLKVRSLLLSTFRRLTSTTDRHKSLHGYPTHTF